MAKRDSVLLSESLKKRLFNKSIYILLYISGLMKSILIRRFNKSMRGGENFRDIVRSMPGNTKLQWMDCYVIHSDQLV